MVGLEQIVECQKKDNEIIKVTIFVTCYNKEKYIANTLDSIFKQRTSFPFQVLVGEDCSTDQSRDILRKYEKKYPEKLIVIYREKNLGINENRNDLFRRCKSPYIAFCDGDDYWIDENCLQRKADFLDHHPEYIGYQTGCYVRRGDSVNEITDLEEHNCLFDYDKSEALHNEYLGQFGGFFFRNIYKYMNEEEFDKYVSYQVDEHGKLAIFAGVMGNVYRQDSKATFVYRHHEESNERKMDNQNRCKSLFLSHLVYVDMIKELLGERMEIDGQLKTLVVNSFITAVKSSFSSNGKENWGQFIFLYNYGYCTKKQICMEIIEHIKCKMKEKLMR